jgi:hypothetical protein
MYFPAFREHQKSPPAPDLAYAVKHVVIHLLVTADIGALKTALQEARLADMLVEGLSFLRQIPRVHLPQVREYLSSRSQRRHKVASA